MEDKRIKPQRHLHLHRPPSEKREAERRAYAEKAAAYSLAGFVIIVVIRLIAVLFD